MQSQIIKLTLLTKLMFACILFALTSNANPTCSDSDNGKEPQQAGFVVQKVLSKCFKVNSSAQTNTEQCVSTELVERDYCVEQSVVEYFCENSIMQKITLPCARDEHCQDGACRKGPQK